MEKVNIILKLVREQLRNMSMGFVRFYQARKTEREKTENEQ